MTEPTRSLVGVEVFWFSDIKGYMRCITLIRSIHGTTVISVILPNYNPAASVNRVKSETSHVHAPFSDWTHGLSLWHAWFMKQSISVCVCWGSLERNQLFILHFFSKKATLTWEKGFWHLPFLGKYLANSLIMLTRYEPVKEDHEFDPKLSNLFLVR